jgi:rubrerythrin
MPASSSASTAPAPGGDLLALVGALRELELGAAGLVQGSANEPSPATTPVTLADRLAILRLAQTAPGQGLAPTLAPFARLGHEWRRVDRILAGKAGDAHGVLEELADLGLLRRTLNNRVHLCPRCGACQINFRETCPSCGAIELHIERLLHHFACAHIGLEREFADGAELACPKCRERLFQLGQDFERPHETYECRQCHALTETPHVGGQCLHCSHVFAAHEARLADVHAYLPTALTARALELGRLTALQVADLLFDPEARLARLDWLVLEARREFLRMQRHVGCTSLVRLRFCANDEPFAWFRFARAREVRELGQRLTSSLRELDLAAPIDGAAMSLLLPETDAEGCARVMARLQELFTELALRTPEGHTVLVDLQAHTWSACPDDIDAAVRLVRGEA